MLSRTLFDVTELMVMPKKRSVLLAGFKVLKRRRKV